jgi:hypothetical protein
MLASMNERVLPASLATDAAADMYCLIIVGAVNQCAGDVVYDRRHTMSQKQTAMATVVQSTNHCDHPCTGDYLNSSIFDE